MKRPFLLLLSVVPVMTVWAVASCATDEDVAGGGGAVPVGGQGGGAPDAGVGGGMLFDGSTGDASGGASCDPNARPIYVLARDEAKGTILRFEPQELTFTPVVPIDCPETAEREVASMAIDRSYRAWVEWVPSASATDPPDPRLDRIDLATGACEPDAGQLPTADGLVGPLGMAFVTFTSGGDSESLYFVDKSTQLYALGGTAALGQFYQFQAGEGTSFSGVELTGTGEGRLFTMIMNWTPEWDHPCTAEDPCVPTVHIGEVDKTLGTAISNVEVPDVPALGIAPGGFAFAHWGGRFWLFISEDFGPTKVYDYDPASNTTALAMEDGPDGVVGAGVSTCAPLVYPR